MATFTISNFSGLTFADDGVVSQTLQVYGIFGPIQNVSVSLGNLDHSRSDDLDMLLVAPNGTNNLVFWSDAGGDTDLADGQQSDGDFTLSDDGALPQPDDGAFQSGPLKPAAYGEVETDLQFGSVIGIPLNHAPSTGTATFAGAFGGTAANGAWTLYVADDTAAETGSLEYWGLTIQASANVSLTGTAAADTIRATLFAVGAGTYQMNSLPTVSFTGVTFFTYAGGGGNDQIFGSAADESIQGGTGRDTIRAGSGMDKLLIAPGEDTAGEVYDGGAGTDTIALTSVNSETLNLRDDTLISIERLEFFLRGSSTATDTILLRAAQFGSGISTRASVVGTKNYEEDDPPNRSDRLDIIMDTATSLNLSGLVFAAFDHPGDRVIIKGDADAETITGTSVADTIDAKGGADNVGGGLGDDLIYVDNAGDVVREVAGEGRDQVLTSVSYKLAAGVSVEFLATTSAAGTAALNLTGNAFGQQITGNAGANIINGGAGADTMQGVGGNDTYFVDDSDDVVDESVAGSGGTDTVRSAFSFDLSDTFFARGTLEHLTLTGTAPTSATGNSLANTLIGNGANNLLNGKAGADTMRGMGGNDLYVVENAGDVVDESIAGSSGTDTVQSLVTFSLSDMVHAKGAIENVMLIGSAALQATGNTLANTLTGNEGANTISGREGNDTLRGNGGADKFTFNTALNATTNVDTMADFNLAADTIVLARSIFTAFSGQVAGSTIAASAFKNLDAPAGGRVDADDRIIYDQSAGDLFYDRDGSGSTYARIKFADIPTFVALTFNDFILA